MPLYGPPSERAAASATPQPIGTAAVGTGTTDARDDHVHATGAGTPSTQAFGDAASTGTGPAAAMTDHKHGMPANPVRSQSSSTPAAVSTTGAVGTGSTDARDDHVHAHEAAHINHDTTWAAKGDLIAGTANDTASVLTVGADDTILMADSAQSTGLKWVASATPSTQAFGDSAAAGTADTFTRGDHKHGMPAAEILKSGLSSDATVNSTTTLAKITGLDLTLAAGSYNFRYMIRYQSAATTTGVKFAVNFTGTQTAFVTNHYWAQALSTAASTAADQDTSGTAVGLASFMATRANNVTVGPHASVDTANSDMLWVVEGLIVVTVSGNLELYHASEVAANSTVMTGSGLVAVKVA